MQLISYGNFLQRMRNVQPTGDMQRQMCRFSRTRLTNKTLMLLIVSTIFHYL